MNQEKIGKFIAECRKNKKMTQSELADKLNVTDKTISRWENGHYMPDISLFNELCNILDIEVVELLNGEKSKNNIDRKEVDETIMKIVNISKDEIREKKKKIITISVFCVLFITIIFILLLIFTNKEKNNLPKPGEKVPFISQIAVKEKEDGWVCHMNIEYLKDNTNMPYYYGYDCENLKYKEIIDFVPTGEEEIGNEKFTYKIGSNHSHYIYNSSYNDDIKNINNYFIENKYNKEISLNDLDDLQLTKISKNDVLELYNKAINSPKVYKWGNIIMLNHPSYLSMSMQKDNYTWYFGYLINFGHIEYVNIELMINDKYLSDFIIENRASNDEKEIYENIQEIESYIIEKQKFDLPDTYKNLKPYTFLYDNFYEIDKLEKE